MRLRKQDSAGDMQFGHNGGDIWHDDVEGVGQSILTRLLLYRGEWFLDITAGTPWGGFPLNTAVVAQGQILAEHTQLSRDMAIRTRVLETNGVLSILSYASQFEPNNRRFSVQMVVDTIYGRLRVGLQPSYRDDWILNFSALSGSDPL